MNESNTPEGVVSSEGLGGWVPVAQRMPPRFAEVIVAIEDGSRVVHALLSWNGADWMYGFGADRYDVSPTHWMPLPKPPNVAGNRLAEGKSELTGLLGGPTRSEKE